MPLARTPLDPLISHQPNGGTMKLFIVGACAVLAVAGCSSSGGHSASTPPSSTTAAYTPTVGADAAIIAGHIDGCTDVQSGDVGKGAPSLSSTATCTLDGHTVIVDSWAAAGDSQISDELASAETYYAYGSAWTTFLADQGATAATTTLQMQMTNDAGGLTKQSLGDDTPAPASLDAQQTVAAAVAKSLGGTVGHAT